MVWVGAWVRAGSDGVAAGRGHWRRRSRRHSFSGGTPTATPRSFPFFFIFIVRFGGMLREVRKDLRARGQIMSKNASLERQVTR